MTYFPAAQQSQIFSNAARICAVLVLVLGCGVYSTASWSESAQAANNDEILARIAPVGKLNVLTVEPQQPPTEQAAADTTQAETAATPETAAATVDTAVTTAASSATATTVDATAETTEMATAATPETAAATVDTTEAAVASSAAAATDETATETTEITTVDGAAVYNRSCLACHSTGVAGAPKIGDKAAWESRIAQGMAELVKHAINGFQGSTGVMPARGGNAALSDDEMKAAVSHLIESSQ